MALRISFNSKRIEGAYGGANQFASGLEKYLVAQGHTVFRELVPDLDVILILTPRTMAITSYSLDEAMRYAATHPYTATVLRVNTLDEQRGSDQGDNRAMLNASRVVDHITYISQFVRRAFHQHGIDATKPDSVILVSADESIFNPQGRQRWQPGEKMKIVTHHWSSNYLKGFDIYERLDGLLALKPYSDLFEFTFIGNVSMSAEFKNTRCIPPLSGHELAEALRQNHVYISAARHEAGGHHYVEAMRCGLPVLFMETGALREYCGEYGIGFTLVDFEAKLMQMPEQYAALFEKVAGAPYTAAQMSREYEAMLVSAAAERRAHPRAVPAPESPFSLARLSRFPRKVAGRIRRAAKVLVYG